MGLSPWGLRVWPKVRDKAIDFREELTQELGVNPDAVRL